MTDYAAKLLEMTDRWENGGWIAFSVKRPPSGVLVEVVNYDDVPGRMALDFSGTDVWVNHRCDHVCDVDDMHDYWRPIPKPPAEQAAGALVESPGTQLWKWIRQFQSRSSDFTFAGVHPEVLRQFLEEHDYDIENLQTQIADKDEEISRLQPFEQRVAELERENREQKTTIRALQDKLIEMGRYVNDECEKKDAELADLRAKLAEREAECKEWEQELADAKSFWDLAEAKAKRWRDRYAELRSREGGE